MSRTMTGGCQCGRVRYAATLDGTDAYLCHCRKCQKATGGFAAAFVEMPHDRLQWLTEPDWYASSPVAKRPFCAACGTPLGFAWADGTGGVDITVGSFDDPSRFTPVAHAGAESLHEAWLDTCDLPRHYSATTPSVVDRWRSAGLSVPETPIPGSIAPDSSSDEVARHIADNDPGKNGWAYLYSSLKSRENPGLVTIGLNPGGGGEDTDWDSCKAFSYKTGINAYLDDKWRDDGSFTPLQTQIQKLKNEHFPTLPWERILSFQLIPFRSQTWAHLPWEDRETAIQFGMQLLPWTLAHLRSDVPVITFGLKVAEPKLLKWFNATNPRTVNTGWGAITATVWDTPKADRLIMLPHLSRYQIFGRPEFVDSQRLFTS